MERSIIFSLKKKVGSSRAIISAPFLFQGRKASFKFHNLSGQDKKRSGELCFDESMEEEIFLSLKWFELEREKPIRARYEKKNGQLHLFIHKNDLQYMIYYTALYNPIKLVTSRFRAQIVHVESRLIPLIHGLVHGDTEVFILCYKNLCSLFHLRKFYTKTKSMTTKFLQMELYLPLRNNFDRFFLFLGKFLISRHISQEDFKLTFESKLLRSIYTFLYCLLVGRAGRAAKDKILTVGLIKYRGIYKKFDVVIKETSTTSITFEATPIQLVDIYNCFIDQKNLFGFEGLKNMYATTNFVPVIKRNVLKEKYIHYAWNFGQSISGLGTTFIDRTAKNMHQHYTYIKTRMEQNNVDSSKEDDEDHQAMHLVLLLLLDSLFLMDYGEKYKQRTHLFYSLRIAILKKKFTNMPFFVQTAKHEESSIGRHDLCNELHTSTLGGAEDGYSTNKWVFPIFLVKKRYDITSEEWKKVLKNALRSNIYKFK